MRDCLLARAVEEADERGLFVGERRRAAATREAREESGGDRERFLCARARRLIAPLVTEERAVARVRELSGRAAVPAWAAFLVAALVGLFVDRIGSSKRIDVLSFPLIGLLAWNVLVYAASGVGALRRRRSASLRASGPSLSAWILRAISAPARRLFRRADGERAGLLSEILEGFLRDWTRVGAALHMARARYAVHAAAAGLALGVIGGMYLRGLVLEYRAGWESTFLSAEAVRGIVGVVLGPAAALSGEPLPSALEIDAMRANDARAAYWIHLYALTVAVWIVVPRLILAAFARHNASRLSAKLPVDWDSDAYFMRLSAVERGRGRRAELHPYSFHPSARVTDGLRALLLDLLGNRTRIELCAPLEYGTESLPAPGGEPGDESCRALIFNLGQSPEQEVQGALVEGAMRETESCEPTLRLFVVVDESPYRARLGEGEEADGRIEERRRSWQRVLRESGIEGLFLELEGPIPPAALVEARRVMWPPRRGASDA